MEPFLFFNIRNKTLILFKTFFSCFTFFIVSQNIWSQDLLLSNKIIGKVKKCVNKTYSVNKALGEFDIDELLSKEMFEYYLDGAIKSKTVFSNQTIKFNYFKNGKLSSIYWDFSDDFKSTGIDSIIYDENGRLLKKFIFEFWDNRWMKNYEYEYKYDIKGNLIQVTQVYDNVKGSVMSTKTYPDLFKVNYNGFILDEIENLVMSIKDESGKIWYSDDGLNESLTGNKPSLADGRSFREISLKNEYDQVGNWTKVTLFTGKTPFRIYLREITYYD